MMSISETRAFNNIIHHNHKILLFCWFYSFTILFSNAILEREKNMLQWLDCLLSLYAKIDLRIKLSSLSFSSSFSNSTFCLTFMSIEWAKIFSNKSRLHKSFSAFFPCSLASISHISSSKLLCRLRLNSILNAGQVTR